MVRGIVKHFESYVLEIKSWCCGLKKVQEII